MRIQALTIRKIFDSRGEPTIEVGVDAGAGMHYAAVPSGKSTGRAEAQVFTVPRAKAALQKVFEEKLKDHDFTSVSEFDRALLSFDSSPDKKLLGGNTALGASVAFCRCLAAASGEPVWKVLRKEFFPSTLLRTSPNTKREKVPAIYSNFINGGRHASDNLAIQEYMVIAETPSAGSGKAAKSISETVENLISLYNQTREEFAKKIGKKTVPVGDEEGFQGDFVDSAAPLELLEKLIRKNKWEGSMSLGVDAAATSFYVSPPARGGVRGGGRKDAGLYEIDGKKLTCSELVELYKNIAKRVSLFSSLEDPFQEEAWEDFVIVSGALRGITVVGDDITVTSAKRIENAAMIGAISGVIIKPNQVGTVSETCAAITMAKKNGVKTIVSHRSGETEDVFIVHLAKAANADGLKIGAPAKERLLKFDEMMRIF